MPALTLDDFMRFLTEDWQEALAHYVPERPRLFLEVVQAAACIFAWEQPGWGEMYDILSAPPYKTN
jgi:hypothetical protein